MCRVSVWRLLSPEGWVHATFENKGRAKKLRVEMVMTDGTDARGTKLGILYRYGVKARLSKARRNLQVGLTFRQAARLPRGKRENAKNI